MKKITIILGICVSLLFLSCRSGGNDENTILPQTVALPAPLHTDGRWFKDTQGRVVILRGMNVGGEVKYGTHDYTEQAIDWTYMHNWGFNVVRLLIAWDAVEPEPGVIDYSFLEETNQQIKMAAGAGIYVFLDMHQDVYGPATCGNGAPAWATPFKASKCESPWGINYFIPSTMQNYDNFWTDSELQAHFAFAWLAVVQRFMNEPNVIAYDLYNEPNYGSRSPWDFERFYLGPFMDRIATAIRSIDPYRIIFYEPFGHSGGGSPSFLPPPVSNVNTVYAPHYYDPSTGLSDEKPYDLNADRIDAMMNLRDRESVGMGDIPWILGEFGNGPGVNHDLFIRDMYQNLDKHMIGATYWAYSKSESGWGWVYPDGTLKDKAKYGIRPYPFAVSGTPISFVFDDDTKVFTLSIKDDPNISAPTEIFIPEWLHYPDGFTVEATGTGWTYEFDGRILKWYSDKKRYSNTIVIKPTSVITPLLLASEVEFTPEVITSAVVDSNDPGVLCDAADAIVGNNITDHQQRTQALFMYNQVLDLTSDIAPSDRLLKARAHFGLGIINFYDLFDVLPTLLAMLGMNISDLIGGLSSPMMMTSGLTTGKISSPLAETGRISQALSCDNVVNFGAYAGSLVTLFGNMMKPTSDNFMLALRYNPDVSLYVHNAVIRLSTDNPMTPANESIALDLSGEWDAGEVGGVGGALDIFVGALKLVASYDGMLQGIINPAFNPTCNVSPGSPEWESVFGPYGTLSANGGMERMLAAKQAFNEGFQMLGYGFDYIRWETDDQSDDIIRYWDCGTDNLCPGDTGYTAPDADGAENNGKFDIGETWGMAQIGNLLSGLLPLPLAELSKGLNPPVLAELLYELSNSVDTGTPVDLTVTLFKPIATVLMGGTPTDLDLYSLSLPALNLGAPFNPPWPSINILNPLKNASGETVIEPPETEDIEHTWPDGSGRIDPMNGILDEAYQFYPDLDESGNTVGVIGGLLYMADIDFDNDFDSNGNLIVPVKLVPMTNPYFNALLIKIQALLKLIAP